MKSEKSIKLTTTYLGMSVYLGANHVMDQLDLKLKLYAGHPSRGKYRGFAALGDKLDHNTLYPFSEGFTNSKEQVRFYNLIAEEVTERLKQVWELSQHE